MYQWVHACMHVHNYIRRERNAQKEKVKFNTSVFFIEILYTSTIQW